MKKSLLLGVAAFAATTGFAQVASLEMQKAVRPSVAPMEKFGRLTDKVAVKKTYTNQTYYTPQGGLYGGWTAEGNGAAAAVYVVPTFSTVSFNNMMSKPTSANWQLNGTDVTEYYMDVNGNYVSSYYPSDYAFYVPTLINGTYQYQFGENNIYYKRESVTLANAAYLKTRTAMSFSDGNSINVPLYAMNDHGSRESSGTYYSNSLVGYGFLDGTMYLFGTGTVTNGGETSTATSATQYFPASSAPLYFDDVFARSITFNANGPIPANDTIYAYVVDANLVTDEDGTQSYQLGDNIIATLYATSENTTGFTSDDEVSGWDGEGDYSGKTPRTGVVYYYNTKKTVDPIMGTESSDPVVIPAGQAFAVVFSDFNKSGVNLGFYGIMANDEDGTAIHGTVDCENGYSYQYRSTMGIAAGLEGMYECIDIPATGFLTSESQSDFPTSSFKGWNALRVSADGKTVSTEGLANTDYDLGCAFVGTTNPWVDDEDNANYSVEIEYLSGGEGWISGVQYDNTYYDGESLTGYNLVAPVCDALPSGTTGRTAKITVYGKADIASTSSIYVFQGDASSTGISSSVVVDSKANTNNAMYNISGQKVSKNYKGLVIVDGKKFINK